MNGREMRANKEMVSQEMAAKERRKACREKKKLGKAEPRVKVL